MTLFLFCRKNSTARKTLDLTCISDQPTNGICISDNYLAFILFLLLYILLGMILKSQRCQSDNCRLESIYEVRVTQFVTLPYKTSNNSLAVSSVQIGSAMTNCFIHEKKNKRRLIWKTASNENLITSSSRLQTH